MDPGWDGLRAVELAHVIRENVFASLQAHQQPWNSVQQLLQPEFEAGGIYLFDSEASMKAFMGDGKTGSEIPPELMDAAKEAHEMGTLLLEDRGGGGLERPVPDMDSHHRASIPKRGVIHQVVGALVRQQVLRHANHPVPPAGATRAVQSDSAVPADEHIDVSLDDVVLTTGSSGGFLLTRRLTNENMSPSCAFGPAARPAVAQFGLGRARGQADYGPPSAGPLASVSGRPGA